MLFSTLQWLTGVACLVCVAPWCNALSAAPVSEAPPEATAQSSLVDSMRSALDNVLDPANPLARKLLEAEMSPTCGLGLLRLVRSIRNLEPWALRILDATGKYPTGLIEGTVVDLGSYDECVATVLRDKYGVTKTRGQYCVLELRVPSDDLMTEHFVPAAAITHKRAEKFTSYWTDPKTPGLRLGICLVDQCNERDIQSLVRTILPETFNATVYDCVTGEYPSMSSSQAAIICILACVAALVLLSTSFHFYLWFRKRSPQEGQLVRAMTSFSLLKNTEYVIRLEDDGPEKLNYSFMNGVRFLSVTWVVLGHVNAGMTEVLSGRLNMLFFFDNWTCTILSAGFLSVDAFMFISGFLLAHSVYNQKRHPIFIAVIGIVRRYIRVMVPVVFLIICMQLLPLVVQGPTTGQYYRNFQDMIDRHWADFLLQIYNFKHEVHSIALIHVWYVSVDFQLFLVSLVVLLAFRWSKFWCGTAFLVLSLLSCVVSAMQVHKTEMPPFMIAITENFRTAQDIMNKYYVLPYYHALCFFSGCTAWLAKDYFSGRTLPKVATACCWFASLGCGVTCVFIRFSWYHEREPTTELGKLSTAFFDRILWSICLSWITLTCSTKRGGIMESFLSWKGFAPLGKLSFAVYLVHMPFYDLMNHVARERTYYSHFSLVTQFFGVLMWSYFLGYLLFVACEAPLGNLDRLVFSGRETPSSGAERKESNEGEPNKKLKLFTVKTGWLFPRNTAEITNIARN